MWLAGSSEGRNKNLGFIKEENFLNISATINLFEKDPSL
jgi:hypothetical protein